MSDKAKKHHLQFRPHFKTHQSAEIGSWFKNFGVTSIAVSSVRMAEYFVVNGWHDITIAFPVNILESEKINLLSEKIKLNITISTDENIDLIKRRITQNTGYFIEVDDGYHRSGIDINNAEKVLEITNKLTKSKLNFKGILLHSGKTYQTKNLQEVEFVHQQAIEKLRFLKTRLSNVYPEIQISIGDTPACSLSEDFTGISEIRPGNFVFYDVMQYNIGSCKLEDIAVFLVCPVVARYPERNEIVIYGGAVHLSKDYILNSDGTKNFGLVCQLNSGFQLVAIENAYVSSLSQEHGIVKIPAEKIDNIKIGDVIAILPIHSCLTADIMKEYLTLEGQRINMMRCY